MILCKKYGWMIISLILEYYCNFSICGRTKATLRSLILSGPAAEYEVFCLTCLYDVTGDCLHLWSDCDHPDDHGLSLNRLAHGCRMEAGAVHTLYSRWCPIATAFRRDGSSRLLPGKRRGYVLPMLPYAHVSCLFILGAFTKLWRACVSFVMSVHVLLSIRLYGTTGLPLDRLSWHLISEYF